VSTQHLLNKLTTTTTQSGVYQMLDKNDKVIYVGKAKNLKKRLSNYFSRRAKDTKTIKLVNNIVDFQIIVVSSEVEALLLENELIKKLQPKYNILLKDAKSYPYIILTKEKYPRISFYRGRKKQDYNYFGPYPSAHFVREAIKLLRKTFKLRECAPSVYQNRSRPCLDYQIGICSAPCVYKNDDYTQNITNATLFLQGKSDEVLATMRTKMLDASNKCEFEEAAKYRDQMINLRQLSDSEDNNLDLDVVFLVQQNGVYLVQIVFVRYGKQIDSEYLIPKNSQNLTPKEVLAAFIPQYYMDKKMPKSIVITQDIKNRELIATSLKTKLIKRVDKDKAKFVSAAELSAKENLKQYLLANKRTSKQLNAIKNILNLEYLPNIIECFDISHHQGENTVASCVQFLAGKPHKKAYKKFNIKNTNIGDDYQAMNEAITRRYRNTENLPDLLLIDGGLGQLNTALKVLDGLQLKLNIVGVAKGEGRKAGLETLILKEGDEVKKISLKPDDIALNLINYARDEAHRFAISTHRKQITKAKTKFGLEAVEGIGAQKSKELLNYFGSLAQIKKASVADIAKVRGINLKIATKIKDFLHY
jgi:excinuclease ABC subunit C